MDIYSFVNSKAVQEHLRKIKYQFNSQETAWLIGQCWKLSYNQKKKYWQELVDTMPDCEVKERGIFDGWDSLHELINVYINVVDRNIKNFYQNEENGKYAYTYTYICEGDSDWTRCEAVYGSLEQCMKDYKKNWNEDIIRYQIRKQSLENVNKVIELEFREDGEIACLLHGETINEVEEKALSNEFHGFWFEFPTPFQKGDLLWSPSPYGRDRREGEGCFVLDELLSRNQNECGSEDWDDTDMCGHCYCMNPDDTIFYDCIPEYMNFEFYNGPYSLEEKNLVVLSKYLKGEITIDVLLNAYQRIAQRMEMETSLLDSWQLEQLRKMGIE